MLCAPYILFKKILSYPQFIWIFFYIFSDLIPSALDFESSPMHDH